MGFNPDIKIIEGKKCEIFRRLVVGFYLNMGPNPDEYGMYKKTNITENLKTKFNLGVEIF